MLQESQELPRPMSSLMKEKLDLKLDVDKRRTIDIDVDRALHDGSPIPVSFDTIHVHFLFA